MKIRSGFVSNSSSSSFLIYGTTVDIEDLKRALTNMRVEYRGSTEDDDYRIRELFEEKSKLSVCGSYDWDHIYVGLSADGVADDETGKQFRDRIEKQLKDYFGKNMKCSYLSEAWYDG